MSDDELAAIEPILVESVQPYVRIHASRPGAPLPLWASKGNDRPYLPRSMPWPTVDGEALYPAIQLDFAEIPELPGFPRSGLLSIFWSADHERWKLLYFPERIDDPAQLHDDFSRVDWTDILYPFQGAAQLAFERRTGCVSFNDFRFEQLVGEDRVDRWLDTDAWDAIWSHVYERSGAGDSRIGGYASPQQEDPRESVELRRYSTLLVQLQNDNFTHEWYIEPAKLARCEFSDVLYHSACD